MNHLKKFEGILQPYRLGEREELLKEELRKKLSSEVIEGDLTIDHSHYLEVESRVKKVVGDVKIKIDKIPLWLADVEVGGDFRCSWNKLTKLEGSPRVVGGDFWCSDNNLTSLEGSPRAVGGDFRCSWNKLTKLEGAPESVSGDFNCSGNKLTTLWGAPRVVGDFNCSGNKLTNLEGAPESVCGNFYCHTNTVEFTEGDVRRVSEVEGKIYI